MRCPKSGTLTLRERQTIALLANGLTVREAADIMFVSRHTADSHRQRAYDKLRLHRRADVVRWVIQQGLDKMTPLDMAAMPRKRRNRIRDYSPTCCP